MLLIRKIYIKYVLGTRLYNTIFSLLATRDIFHLSSRRTWYATSEKDFTTNKKTANRSAEQNKKSENKTAVKCRNGKMQHHSMCPCYFSHVDIYF